MRSHELSLQILRYVRLYHVRMETLNEDLEVYVGEKLKLEDYKAVEGRIASSGDKDVADAYFGIYPQLFRKYADVIENFDEENEAFLLSLLEYTSKKVDIQTRYMSILEVYNNAASLKALLYLCKELLNMLFCEGGCHLDYNLLDELRDDVLPYFLHKLRGFVKEAEAVEHAQILRASDFFINIFRGSQCKNYFLLDDLVSSVISCVPISKEGATFEVLTKYVNVYRNKNEGVPPNPVILAISLQEEMTSSTIQWLIPFLVYSPVYNIYRCIPVFLDCLEKSENNLNSLSVVYKALQAIVHPIDNGTLCRDLLACCTDFIGKFLAVTVYPVLTADLRSKCLELCKKFIHKFEPVAQVLIIRRIINLIAHDKYKDIMEPQAIAWLLDCYRNQLGKHACFSDELGYLWGDLADINYENLHEAVNFYASLMIVAQYQALLKINKPLLKAVRERILCPLKTAIAEWTHLMEIKESNEKNTLPYLQTMLVETLKFVDAFLNAAIS